MSLEQEGEEFLSPESAATQTVILVVGCRAGPWGEPSAFGGAELAVSSNCISRSGSRFWTNHTDAFKGNDFIFGPVQLEAGSDPSGDIVRGAVRAVLTRVPGVLAGLTVLHGPTTAEVPGDISLGG